MNCFETMFQMEPYVFCDENLSDYEKTIYILAIAYGASPIYRLSKKDIEELSLWLEVDFKLLAKALENEMNFPCGNAIIKFGDDTIECGEYFKNDFFDVIVKLLFAYKKRYMMILAMRQLAKTSKLPLPLITILKWQMLLLLRMSVCMRMHFLMIILCMIRLNVFIPRMILRCYRCLQYQRTV